MTQEAALSRIAQALVVGPGVAPGASLAVARRVGGSWSFRLGAAGHLDRRCAVATTPRTPFDLASVTKPVFALTLARLDARGAIRRSDPLGQHLPEAVGTPSADVPLDLLLAHRAGLESHLRFFAPLQAGVPFERRRCLRQACQARRADACGRPPPEGFAPVYSDLGYLLLGAAVERSIGKPLDEVVRAEVVAQLGLDLRSARQALADGEDFARVVAPTEVVPWRGGVVSGMVHDENAWALAGHGVAGHAGLFGTAEAVARFGCAVLDILAGRAEGFLAAELCRALVRERPGSTLRAGFDGVSGPESSAGRMGPRAFGHLGFTGTSLWCDPDSEIVTVILTNRVHPTREHTAIRQARPAVQNALLDLPAGGV